MDEPLSNLDAKLRNQMRAEIILLRQKIDTTFVYVTHDQTEAMTLGDRIVIMKDGFIKQVGTPTEVFEITKNYLIFYIIGFMFNIILTIIMEGLRAIGNTKIPLVFVAITSILNIFLDPIFIKMGYGVTGTAIATMVSIFIGMIISVIYASKKSNLLKIDLKYLKLKNSLQIKQ